MTFKEAYKCMNQGKKVKRPCFKGYYYLDPETGTLIINNGQEEKKYGNFNTLVKNVIKDDWEVVNEGGTENA